MPKAFDLDAANKALRRLQQGDRRSAREVFGFLWPVVASFCRKALGDASEDAAQETLMKIFQQAHNFRNDGNALAWALELASWECRTELRRRSRNRGNSAMIGEPTMPGETPDAAIEREQLTAALQECVGQLSEKDQTVVNAVLKETFPTNASPAVRKQKERAITRLGQAWRTLYGE